MLSWKDVHYVEKLKSNLMIRKDSLKMNIEFNFKFST